MDADGKSTLASVSEWNTGKINCAVELIHPESGSVDISRAFKEQSLLNVQELIDYSTISMVYDSIHGKCPE